KLYSCLEDDEWHLALRRAWHASDTGVVCPVCGGRPEDEPIVLPDRVPPPRMEPIEPPPEPAEVKSGGGGRSVLMFALGGVLGLVVAGVVGYLFVDSAQSELVKSRARTVELDERLRGHGK